MFLTCHGKRKYKITVQTLKNITVGTERNKIMKVYKIYPTGFAATSYIVTADDKTAAVIDCAQDQVYDRCRELGLKPEGVLLTHGHFDHIGGCARFASYGIPIYATEEEADNMFGADYAEMTDTVIKRFPLYLLSGGQTITVAGIDFKVISTPGHSEGSVCYLAEGCLFSGDTLFRENVGRTDLPTGSWRQLYNSIKKLYALPGDFTVYCGHDEDTTLNYERLFNPYVKGD